MTGNVIRLDRSLKDEGARHPRSLERKRKSLRARIEELDLEQSIVDRLRLSYELIQTLFGYCAVALIVNVAAVSSARRLSVDKHAKSHGRFAGQ